MNDLADLARGKLRDPLVLDWALDRHADARCRNDGEAARLAAAWFDEQTVAHWVRDGDDDLVPQLLEELPPAAWTPVVPALVECWPAWHGRAMAAGARVLARVAPEQVLQLFSSACEAGDLDFDGLAGVIESLPALPPGDARTELLEWIVRDVDETVEDRFARSTLGVPLLGALSALAPERTGEHLGRLIRASSDAEELDRRLTDSALALFGERSLFSLIADRLEGDRFQPLDPMNKLFRPGAPLEAAEQVLGAEHPAAAAAELLAASASEGPATAAMGTVLRRELERASGQQANLLAAFAVALRLQPYLADPPDLGGLGLADAVALILWDEFGLLPTSALAAHLEGLDRAEVAEELADAFAAAEDYGALRVVEIMAELAWPEFVPTLIDALGSDCGDLTAEEAKRALCRIGAPGRDALLDAWERLDYSQRIYGISVLTAVGGQAVADHGRRVFSEMMATEVEEWCRLAAGAPSPDFVELLRPQLCRRDQVLDEAFCLLCALFELAPPELPAVRERVALERAQIRSRREAFHGWDLASSDLSLLLRCDACGHENRYRARRVILDPEPPHTWYVADESACTSCGDPGPLKPTTMAQMAATAELIRLKARAERGLPPDGPLVLARAWAGGREMPVVQALAHHRRALEADPEEVGALLNLATLELILLDRPADGEGHLRRALAADPLAVEAIVALAALAADSGDPAAAYRSLREALPARERWRFYGPQGLTVREAVRDFARLHNRLVQELGIRGVPALHDSFTGTAPKAGRNDPCPCGSGKKHKKCCGR